MPCVSVKMEQGPCLWPRELSNLSLRSLLSLAFPKATLSQPPHGWADCHRQELEATTCLPRMSLEIHYGFWGIILQGRATQPTVRWSDNMRGRWALFTSRIAQDSLIVWSMIHSSWEARGQGNLEHSLSLMASNRNVLFALVASTACAHQRPWWEWALSTLLKLLRWLSLQFLISLEDHPLICQFSYSWTTEEKRFSLMFFLLELSVAYFCFFKFLMAIECGMALLDCASCQKS